MKVNFMKVCTTSEHTDQQNEKDFYIFIELKL